LGSSTSISSGLSYLSAKLALCNLNLGLSCTFVGVLGCLLGKLIGIFTSFFLSFFISEFLSG